MDIDTRFDLTRGAESNSVLKQLLRLRILVYKLNAKRNTIICYDNDNSKILTWITVENAVVHKSIVNSYKHETWKDNPPACQVFHASQALVQHAVQFGCLPSLDPTLSSMVTIKY